MTLPWPALASPAELERLSAFLLEVASHLRQDTIKPAPSRRYSPDLQALVGIAKAFRQARSKRSRHRPGELFGEPAWDILLDLFVQSVACRAVSITSATLASGVPCTTALRHIALLQQNGLIERQRNTRDRRVSYVALTEKGRQAMTAALGETLPTAAGDSRWPLSTNWLAAANK